MQEHSSLRNKIQDESLDIREQFDKFIIHWKWFLASIVICFIIALLYLRYTIPQYSASATILVKDERKGGLQTEMSAFADLGLMSGIKNNVDNEIEIIKSRNIIQTAVKKLNFNVTYFEEGNVKSVEVYKGNPIDISFFDTNELFYKKVQTYIVKSKSDSTFELNKLDGTTIGVFYYGSVIRLADCKMVVTKKPLLNSVSYGDFSITVKINNLANVVQSYKNRIKIAPLNKNSSVVELVLNDPVAEKAEDLLNAMIEIYNQDAIDDKNYISKNTQKFIEERLKFITQELGEVELKGENFMTSNRLTDIESDASVYVENSVVFEKSLIETETQIKVINSMLEYVNNSSKEDIIPSNIIPSDSNASILINQYNELIIERNRILSGGTQKNAIIINYNNRIDEMRKNIKESLRRLIESLKIKRGDLQKQNNVINSKISQIPRQARESNVIGRQQKIKESLYLYLLQKREEIGISLAVTAPNAKLIDSAKATASPISPNRNFILLGALLAGLLIPFLIIFVLDLLDTKVKNRQDIEASLSIPFLGDIPKSENQDELINASSRSSSAEAIRIVRTNLEFMLNNVPDGKAKTIFITSTLPKEGKTFVAINLASTIALSGKKVLLIGLDIRNPKIDKYVNIPSKGLTNYLAKPNEKIEDYIVKLDNFENYYVLPSGLIPPNPVDLLMSPKMKDLFENLNNQYEYIIVDTAPVSLVTDTLLVAKYADLFVYVMRANYLDKRLLKIAESFYQEKKLPNMAVLLNDTIWRKTYGYGYGYAYGYGYGYGYGEDITVQKKSWKERLFKK